MAQLVNGEGAPPCQVPSWDLHFRLEFLLAPSPPSAMKGSELSDE
jgi:hypothetical protein